MLQSLKAKLADAIRIRDVECVRNSSDWHYWEGMVDALTDVIKLVEGV